LLAQAEDNLASSNASEASLLSKDAAWAIMATLSSAWVIVFVAFLLLIKKQFVGTFFSLRTGNEEIQYDFLEAVEDSARARILRRNRVKWLAIRGDVRQWCLEGWAIWDEEKPAWFTPSWVAKVDDDMIPAEFLEAARQAKIQQKRRQSIDEMSAEKKTGGRARTRGEKRSKRSKNKIKPQVDGGSVDVDDIRARAGSDDSSQHDTTERNRGRGRSGDSMDESESAESFRGRGWSGDSMDESESSERFRGRSFSGDSMVSSEGGSSERD
jgi:hypothetical protein